MTYFGQTYFKNKQLSFVGLIVEERSMSDHSIEITPIDDQIPLLPQTKKDEVSLNYINLFFYFINTLFF